MPVGVELNPAELIGLALCIMILAYLVVNWQTVAGSRYVPIVYAFLCLTGAFLCTTLEEFLLEDMFNVMEHSLMAAGALLVAVGCRRALDAEVQDSAEIQDSGTKQDGEAA